MMLATEQSAPLILQARLMPGPSSLSGLSHLRPRRHPDGRLAGDETNAHWIADGRKSDQDGTGLAL
jgi:hypothetical protein